MQRDEPPNIQLPSEKDATVRLSGAWLIHLLSDKQTLSSVNASLANSNQHMAAEWDLTGISAIDHLGANLLWQAWSKRLPARIKMNPAHQGLFARLEEVSKLPIPQRIKPRLTRVMRIGSVVLAAFHI